MDICKIENCEKISIAKGFCRNHYNRNLRRIDKINPPSPTIGMSPVERLDYYTVKKEGCWDWTAAKNTKGYGQIYSNGKSIGAHRLRWIELFGNIPTGKLVLHKCDNPKCNNPDHLFLGTNKDNMRDMVLKGRSGRGEKQHFSKLKESDIPNIRELLSLGIRHYDIAFMYAVKKSCISFVNTGRTWSHVQ